MGSRSSLNDVQRVLALVPRLTATLLISKLLVHLDPDRVEEWLAFDRAVLRSLLLRPPLREAVNALDNDPSAPRIAFHRQQLLVALALAQHWCPEQDRPTTDPNLYFLIGEALLRVSDLLQATRIPSDEEGVPGIGATLISYFAESNPPSPHSALLRTDRLIGRAEWETDTTLRRLRARFEEQVGLSLREYLHVLVHLYVRLVALHRLENWNTLASWRTFAAGHLTAPVRGALEELALPFRDLPSLIPEPSALLRDRSLEPIRSHGLISLPDEQFLYVDYVFGTQQATNGLLWRLSRLCGSDDEREALLRAWGSLLEGYLHDRLGGVLGSRYLRSPKDGEGQEITDALVNYGDEVALLEFKRGFLPQDVKYSGEVRRLEDALRRKFVKKDQLGRALQRLFGQERLGVLFLSSMQRPNPRAPRVVYPVLVVEDPSLATPGVENFLGDLVALGLSGLGLPSRPRVERLTVATLDDVESLALMLGRGLHLKRVLRERLDVDPHALNTLHNFLCDVAVRMRLDSMVDRDGIDRVLDGAREFWLRVAGEGK